MQRDELLVGRLGGDVDAAVAHEDVRVDVRARAADVSDAELGERLAARTLELIDEPSESARRGAAWPPTSHALAAGPATSATPACSPGVPARRCCSPATSTPCPRRATGRAAATASACTGSARPT